VPGHYLQRALSNRYPSTLRGVLWSGPFVDGWAVYAERVMIDDGYLDYDPLKRLINLRWYLRVVTNAIIDSAIHVDGMTRDEAIKLMIEGGFQSEWTDDFTLRRYHDQALSYGSPPVKYVRAPMLEEKISRHQP
jgi:uncharacterized protein (DUF885 family)